MEGETGKVMLIEEMAGKQEDLHSERASSTTRKFQAVVTCVHTPAKFWARIGEGEVNVARDNILYAFLTQ